MSSIRAIAIFDEVCELPSHARDARLGALCDGDVELLAVVRRMLAEDAASGALLDRTVSQGAARWIAEDLLRSLAVGLTSDVAPPMPESIGPYPVLGVLGGGGMGIVYEAEQAKPRRSVAIKVLRERVTEQLGDGLFEQEVEALGALLHPAIPQIYEAGSVAGLRFLVMELVRGQTLDLAVRGRSQPERLDLLVRICDGVAFAHAAGFVHCDLKPANILVTESGQPKVLDFGLSRREGAESGIQGGTPAYMSPEQRGGTAPIGPPTDIWALGVVATQILAGALPGDAPRQAPDLQAVLDRCLAPDPADRYPTASALGDDLARLRDHLPVSARRTPPLHRARLFLRRHRVPTAIVAGVTTLALLSLVGVQVTSGVLAQRAQADRFQRAAARLDQTNARLDALVAEGRDAEAQAIFDAFVTLPENFGTPSIARAWLTQADRAGHDAKRQTRALAEAYVAATDVDVQQQALTRLATGFAERWEWTALVEASRLLSDIAPDAPATRSLASQALLARRDLAAAAAAQRRPDLAELLSHWSVATRTGHRGWVATPTTLDGEPRIALSSNVEGRLTFTHPDASLTLDRTIDSATQVTHLLPLPMVVPESDGLVVANAIGDADPSLWQVEGDKLVQLTTWHDARILTAVAVSTPEGRNVVTGSGPYQRRMTLLSEADGWQASAPDPAVDQLGSDVQDLRVSDLDGDGDLELIATLGPWRAYDVRVYDLDPFRLRARRQLGWVAATDTLDDQEIVVTKIEIYGNAWVLGEKTPFGEPPGLMRLRLDGDDLDIVEHIAPSFPGPDPDLHLGRVFTGDLNADGRDDMVADNGHGMLVLLRDGEGWEQLHIPYLSPILVTNLDDDPADEVVVKLFERYEEVWVLGTPEGTALPLLDRPVPVPSPPPLTDPATVRVWSRAMDLVRMGLADLAASALSEHAATQPLDAAAELKVAAGELWLDAEVPDRATTAFEEAVASASPGSPTHARALAGAAVARWQDHDVPGALRWLHAEGADTTAIATRLGLERVPERAPRTVLTFSGALPPSWTVYAPESFSAKPLSDALRLTTFSDQDVIASLPLRAVGHERGMEVELDVHHIELGSGIRVNLVVDGTHALSAGVSGHGGADRTFRFAGCLVEERARIGGEEPFGPEGTPPETLRLRIHYLPSSQDNLCEIHDATGRSLGREHIDEELSDGEWRLEIGGFVEAGSATDAMSQVSIRKITLYGFELATDDPPEPRPLARLDRAVAFARARDPAPAREILRAVLHDADPVELGRLRRYLRQDLDHVGPLLAEVDRAAYRELLVASLTDASRYYMDPDIRDVLTSPEIEGFPVDTPAGLTMAWSRARLFRASGQPDQALAELQRIQDAPDESQENASQARLFATQVLWEAGRVEEARAMARTYVRTSASPEMSEQTLARHLPQIVPGL